jgi:hypothetical protein
MADDPAALFDVKFHLSGNPLSNAFKSSCDEYLKVHASTFSGFSVPLRLQLQILQKSYICYRTFEMGWNAFRNRYMFVMNLKTTDL